MEEAEQNKKRYKWKSTVKYHWEVVAIIISNKLDYREI